MSELSERIRYQAAHEAMVEFRDIILDYFQNDREGWTRPYAEWRKRAARSVGIELDVPTVCQDE